MRMLAMILLFSLSLVPLSHSDIASWVDENGTRHFSNTETPEGNDSIRITKEHISKPHPAPPTPVKKTPPDRKKAVVRPSGGAEFGSRGDGNGNESRSYKSSVPQKKSGHISVHTQKELCEKAKQRLKEAQKMLRTYPYLDERQNRDNKKHNEDMKEYLKYNVRTRQSEMRKACSN